MRARLQYLWYRITASLWLVPGLMILAAALLALAMIWLDASLPAASLKARWILRIGPDGARQLLATIAGSMITVARRRTSTPRSPGRPGRSRKSAVPPGWTSCAGRRSSARCGPCARRSGGPGPTE